MSDPADPADPARPTEAEVLGENSRALHGPPPPVSAQTPMGLPVMRTAAFAFDSAQEYTDLLSGSQAGYSYSRIDNPTADAFAQSLAALEGFGLAEPVAGQAFSSGMAAISSTIMAFTRAGAHVVAPQEIYGGTYHLLTEILSRFGVTVTFVNMSDPVAVRRALRPQTSLVWAEVISNPTVSVADLPTLAGIAHDAGIPLAVDSTFASPAVCRPLRHGVDLVVHSATKYIGGHSDVTGGAVVARPGLLASVRALRVDLGGSLSPDDAFLLHRGLSTLPLRVARHCAVAQQVAEKLEGHPALGAVAYPGLPSHRDHHLASRLFEPSRFGSVVTVDVRAGYDAGMALCDGLRLATIGSSLGGTHTLVSHVASTTHRQLTPQALADGGIALGAVRISCGLEDPEDLVADLMRALDTLT